MLKGGEEVRTDQRVEQLFAVMNGLMARSPAAAAAKLQVRPAATAPFQAMVCHLSACAPAHFMLQNCVW